MNIKFISYTTRNCLINGELTLKIDNVLYTFGNFSNCDIPKFWNSLNNNWVFDETIIKDLPNFIVDNKQEIIDLMNKYIPKGHCDSCI